MQNTFMGGHFYTVLCTINSWMLLTIFAKSFILDVWENYKSVYNNSNRKTDDGNNNIISNSDNDATRYC